jgi:MFS family permease
MSLGYRPLVAALAVGQIVAWAAVYYGFSSFVLPMMAETGWSKPVVMGANTLGLLVWGLATYAAGACVDRGHARALMCAGCACAAAGFALWAVAVEPWMLYAAWVLLGLASAATLYEPAFNVITRRFPQRYRSGITAVTLVGGLASTLSFPVVAALIAAVGWRGALLALAAVMGLLMLPLHAWALRGESPAPVPATVAETAALDLRQALRTDAFWLLTACFTAYAVVMAALWAHAVPLMAAKGLDEAQALGVLVWVGPAQVAGRWVVARFGAGIPLRALGVGVLWLMAGSMVLLAWAQHPALLVLWAVLYGVANGLVTIVRGALVPEYFGRAHIGRIGGAMSGVSLMLRSVGPVLVALSLLWLPGYPEATLLMAGLGALSALAFMRARPPAQPAQRSALRRQ